MAAACSVSSFLSEINLRFLQSIVARFRSSSSLQRHAAQCFRRERKCGRSQSAWEKIPRQVPTFTSDSQRKWLKPLPHFENLLCPVPTRLGPALTSPPSFIQS